MAPVWFRVREAPLVVLVSCPTWVLIVDVPELPVFTVSVPELMRVPLPDMDPAPLAVKAIPPLAVTVPYTFILLPELTPTVNEPAPSLFVFSWMEPVWLIVSDAPEVELASCPTCVLIVEVPLLPPFTVNRLLLMTLPAPLIVLLPDTPRVTPPFAVIMLGSVMFPELDDTDNEPEPSLFVLSWIAPVWFSVREPPVVALVSCPTWVLIVDVPVLPAIIVNVPELTRAPLPEITPAALVAKLIPLFAVTVPDTFILLPESTARVNEPALSLLVFKVMEPIWLILREAPVVELVSCPT